MTFTWKNVFFFFSFFVLLEKNFLQLISCHWSLSIPPENIKKQRFFGVFRKHRKRSVAWNELKVPEGSFLDFVTIFFCRKDCVFSNSSTADVRISKAMTFERSWNETTFQHVYWRGWKLSYRRIFLLFLGTSRYFCWNWENRNEM